MAIFTRDSIVIANQESGKITMPQDEDILNYGTPSSLTVSSGDEIDHTGETVTQNNVSFWNESNFTDGDLDSFSNSSVPPNQESWVKIDYGSSALRSIKWKNFTGTSAGSTYTLEYSDNDSDWTTESTSSSFTGQFDLTITKSFRYLRLRINAAGGGLQWYIYEAWKYLEETESVLFDDNTDFAFKTDEETNPTITVDCTGADVNLVQLAYFFSDTGTETELTIDIATDAAPTTWINVRTILTSLFISGQYNYIRFNSTVGRYIRIRGNSGNSLSLACNEIKYKSVSSNELASGHIHLTIDETNSTLAIDGA